MSKFLIDIPDIQVQAALAKKIGLHEAIILQWIHGKGQQKEYNFIYDSSFQIRFPFWNHKTIFHIIDSLEKKGFIDIDHHALLESHLLYGDGKAYYVKYEKINALELNGEEENE